MDTSAAARPTAFVLRTIKNAAAFLTVGGRLALSAPATITDLSDLLRVAGFTVDEVYGIDPPGDDERVEHVLRARFGSGSIAFYRAMRLNCEPGFVQPVIATCLAEDAATVLRICRRTQNDETTPSA